PVPTSVTATFSMWAYFVAAEVSTVIVRVDPSRRASVTVNVEPLRSDTVPLKPRSTVRNPKWRGPPGAVVGDDAAALLPFDPAPQVPTANAAPPSSARAATPAPMRNQVRPRSGGDSHGGAGGGGGAPGGAPNASLTTWVGSSGGRGSRSICPDSL